MTFEIIFLVLELNLSALKLQLELVDIISLVANLLLLLL